MKSLRRQSWATAGLFLFVVLGVSVLHAQHPVYKPGEYPAPRYPKLPKNPTLDDLMPIARKIVRKPMGPPNKLLAPGFAVKPGERIIFFVARDHDPLVLEALRRAIEEVGAKLDIMVGNDFTPGGNGSLEIPIKAVEDDGFEIAWTGGIPFHRQIQIALAGNYAMGASGESINVDLPASAQGKIRWVPLPWVFMDQFLLSDKELPAELLKLIDDTTWSELRQAVSIRATDPEGTDISWVTVPEAFAGNQVPGHLNIRGQDRWSGKTKPGTPGATGIVAGTWNHTGPFPAIRISFRDDRIQGIEAGGPYGEAWRAVVEKYKDVTWPTKQGPGLLSWLFEAALGTNPKGLRPKDALRRVQGNWMERLRAGIIHWGIGTGTDDADGWLHQGQGSGETAKYLQEHPGLPAGHIHVHNYFMTVELTMRDGHKKLLVNKGHLTTLDQPEIRRTAAQYGDPDELLGEIWIPAVPGINVPGDYSRDYAADPAAFYRNDMAKY